MRVEMLTHIGGYRDGKEWPDAGDTIDVPDYEAADLIGAGYAKEVTDDQAHDEPAADRDAEAVKDSDDQPGDVSDDGTAADHDGTVDGGEATVPTGRRTRKKS